MKNKGQTTLEATILIALATAAFLAMFGYFKGSVQGNWRSNSDSFSPDQYDPARSVPVDTGLTVSSTLVTAKINDEAVQQFRGFGSPATEENQINTIAQWGVYRKKD